MSTLQQTTADMRHLIEDALNCLCIPPSLLGYTYLTYIVWQVAMEPLRIKGLTKQIYPEVARLYGTNAKAVEHDVRTAIHVCWSRRGKETLDRMAHRRLVQRPRATEFIAIVAQYIKRRSLQ